MNNNQATLNKLDTMRLHGMSRTFRSAIESNMNNGVTPDELLAHLVDAEWDDRKNRKLERLVNTARFKYKASFEEIDFGLKRNLDKNMLLRLSDCKWIRNYQNIIITGPTGVGKSFIASALGHQACIYGFKTGYYFCAKLFKEFKYRRDDKTYLTALKKVAKQTLIIFDDIGLEPFDASSRLALLEILEDRVNSGSIIVVSQIPVIKWHGLFGDPTISDAICDRIIHNAHRIEMKGESVRKKFAKGV
jgi:DNA replication protein DnaC